MSPIKPEHRHRYTPECKAAFEVVRRRAGGYCELCAAPNGVYIRRLIKKPASWTMALSAEEHEEWIGPIKVVLTVAHLDPTYESHDPKHMLHLCQRCHLKIDAHLHSKERTKTRIKKAVFFQ